MLVDHADTESDRIVRICDLNALPINKYLAAVGVLKAVSYAHDRRFAGTILTDDRVDGSLFNFDRNVVICDDGTEGLCDVLEFKHRGRSWFVVRCSLSWLLRFGFPLKGIYVKRSNAGKVHQAIP
jgi:hypothetical protein